MNFPPSTGEELLFLLEERKKETDMTAFTLFTFNYQFSQHGFGVTINSKVSKLRKGVTLLLTLFRFPQILWVQILFK